MVSQAQGQALRPTYRFASFLGESIDIHGISYLFLFSLGPTSPNHQAESSCSLGDDGATCMPMDLAKVSAELDLSSSRNLIMTLDLGVSNRVAIVMAFCTWPTPHT